MTTWLFFFSIILNSAVGDLTVIARSQTFGSKFECEAHRTTLERRLLTDLPRGRVKVSSCQIKATT